MECQGFLILPSTKGGGLAEKLSGTRATDEDWAGLYCGHLSFVGFLFCPPVFRLYWGVKHVRFIAHVASYASDSLGWLPGTCET